MLCLHAEIRSLNSSFSKQILLCQILFVCRTSQASQKANERALVHDVSDAGALSVTSCPRATDLLVNQSRLELETRHTVTAFMLRHLD